MPVSSRERTQNVQTLSVRLPAALKSRAAKAAEARQVSFNTFVTRLIEKAVEETEEKELCDGFTLLGSDPELSDVEFAFHAQAEAALYG
jgi:hypothetical protein